MNGEVNLFSLKYKQKKKNEMWKCDFELSSAVIFAHLTKHE